MTARTIITVLSLCVTWASYGQTPLRYDLYDSICAHGKKYIEPERKKINFPAKQISVQAKTEAFHKALPDSLNNEENEYWRDYRYYLGDEEIYDYDPAGDSIFLIGDKFSRILKDTYFFDVNGDGLPDFIHYPMYYKALMYEVDKYEFFIQQKDGGYKIVPFFGYITAIKFHKDGSLDKMTTFVPECCGGNQVCSIHHYAYNRQTNELILTQSQMYFVCQWIKRK